MFAGGPRGRKGASRRRAPVARATPPPPAARHGRDTSSRPRASHGDSCTKQRIATKIITGRFTPGRRRSVPPAVRSQRPPHTPRTRASVVRHTNTATTATSDQHSFRQIRLSCGRHVHCYSTAAILRFSLPHAV